MAQDTEIERLKTLTEVIPTLVALTKNTQQGSVVEYATEKGAAIAFDLINNGEVSISRTFFSNGTVFPEHHHTEREWLICTKGECKILRGEGHTTLLTVGDYIVLEPNESHSATFSDDTWLVCIAVPSSAGFPGGV